MRIAGPENARHCRRSGPLPWHFHGGPCTSSASDRRPGFGGRRTRSAFSGVRFFCSAVVPPGIVPRAPRLGGYNGLRGSFAVGGRGKVCVPRSVEGCERRQRLCWRQSLRLLPDSPADAQATCPVQSGLIRIRRKLRILQGTPRTRKPMSWPAPDNRHSQLSRSAGLCACLIGILAGDVIAAEPTDPFLAWQSSAAYPRDWQWPLRIATPSPRSRQSSHRINRPGCRRGPPARETRELPEPERFNLHAQATIVAQGDPPFAADYSGPNSLNPAGERQQTLAADLFVGLRLWHGQGTARRRPDVGEGFGLKPDVPASRHFPNAE